MIFQASGTKPLSGPRRMSASRENGLQLLALAPPVCN